MLNIENKKCKYCGRIFELDGRRKYCSVKCSKAYWKKYYNKQTLNKKCVICGKEFETSKTNKTHCSPECVKEDYKNRIPSKEKKPCEEKNCVICGKPFVVFPKNKKTCSPECSKIRTRETSRECISRKRKAIKDEEYSMQKVAEALQN